MQKKTQTTRPITVSKCSGTGKTVSTVDVNKLSFQFCERCRPVQVSDRGIDYHVFIDRIGRGWYCAMPYQCDHAIILDGSIHSCRILTSILNSAEREAGTIVSELCDRVAKGEAVVVEGRL